MIVAILGTLGSCGIETSSRAPVAPIPPEVDRLANWLTGSFDSSEQAERDPAFLDISLNACRIWPDRTDGRWIYVEQARSDQADSPYRQRAYRIRFDGQGQLVSEVFAFPQGSVPEGGSWRTPHALDRVDPFMLLPREGCTVYLEPGKNESFIGGTQGTGCESDLNGAAYATSEVMVEANRFTSWDRGFDSEDKQVWGSEAGAYEFRRRRP